MMAPAVNTSGSAKSGSRSGTRRSTAAAGAALVGAGVIAASVIGHGTPTAAPTPEQVRQLDVRLAANSISNIPANIIQTAANIPAVQYQALQQTIKAFNDSGNWWLYIPTNVVGFDQQDYEKVKAISLLLMPIPLVADAESDQLWITLATFAPMTPNCTGVPGPCSDPLYFLQYGQVPTWELINGYTFPEIKNTIDPDDQYYTTADGTKVSIQPWWSGQTVKLDPLGPAKAIWETLTQDPTGVEQGPTAQQWATAYGQLATATFNGLNPFVSGTYCLPCQLFGTAGAPGSLPKFALFGNYYTLFDLGQQLTDKNWVGGPDYDETNREDYVNVLNFWSPEAWQQLGSDGVTSVKDSLAMIPQLPTLIPQNLTAFGEQLDTFSKLLANNIIANGVGLGQAAGTTFGSADELAAMIKQSITNALPQTTNTSATTTNAAVTTVSSSAAIPSIAGSTPAATSVTVDATTALTGSSTPTASETPSTTTSTSTGTSTGTGATSSDTSSSADSGDYVGKHRADDSSAPPGTSQTGSSTTDSGATGSSSAGSSTTGSSEPESSTESSASGTSSSTATTSAGGTSASSSASSGTTATSSSAT